MAETETELLLKYVADLNSDNCTVYIKTEQFGNYMHFDRIPFLLGITRIAREYLEIIFTDISSNLTIIFGSEIYSLYSKVKFIDKDNVATVLLSQDIMENINNTLKQLVPISPISSHDLDIFNANITTLLQ